MLHAGDFWSFKSQSSHPSAYSCQHIPTLYACIKVYCKIGIAFSLSKLLSSHLPCIRVTYSHIVHLHYSILYIFVLLLRQITVFPSTCIPLWSAHNCTLAQKYIVYCISWWCFQFHMYSTTWTSSTLGILTLLQTPPRWYFCFPG